jgi:hypothetical protein
MGGLGPEQPEDQREDDGKSVVFDGAPLPERLEILGAPVLTLAFAADQPVASVMVRLNDVAPDGSSLRVTYGVLNLTHRESHAEPRALRPGERTMARIRLNEIGHAFPPGHRLRVAISTAYWPIVWPTPKPVTLTVHAGETRLELPVRAPRPEDAPIRFGPAFTAPRTRRTVLRPGRAARGIERDLATGETLYTVLRDDGRSTIDAIGVTTELRKQMTYRIRDDDPTSARMAIEQSFLHAHSEWRTRIETRTVLACTGDTFIVEADLQAFDGDQRFFARSWTRSIPRDLV